MSELPENWVDLVTDDDGKQPDQYTVRIYRDKDNDITVEITHESCDHNYRERDRTWPKPLGAWHYRRVARGLIRKHKRSHLAEKDIVKYVVNS